MKQQEYDDSDDINRPPSKTKIKQQMHDLQDLGEELVKLSKEHLAEVELPDNLRIAVREAKKMKSFGAIKRHMQYIGKLMRDVETAPIQAKLAEWNGTSKQHITWLHQLERWRERLLTEPDALTELLGTYPGADVQHLRALIRNAIKEKELAKTTNNFREIFQILRELIPEHLLLQPAAIVVAEDEAND